jgi:threonine/homoserine/homoserine lactone efflux protein
VGLPGETLLFAGAALLMALTPGPNMIYVMSRSVCQGRRAGVISLFGVVAGFLFHMVAAAGGLTALLLSVPPAYEAIRWMGAIYLLYLAWQTLRAGGQSPLTPRQLDADPPAKLFLMGFLTNVLNPKMAAFYLSIFPQFLSPEHGSVFAQSLQLGLIQIAVSLSVNLCVVLSASRLVGWLGHHPQMMVIQRYLTGLTLAAFAVRLAVDRRGAP